MTAIWRGLTPDDLALVSGLAQRCVRADGGLLATTSTGFLQRRYAGPEIYAIGAFAGPLLVAAGSVRPADPGASVVGIVDPGYRGRGLGATLLDRLLAQAATRPGPVRVETESLTPEAERLFAARGLAQTFAEDVLHRSLRPAFPAVATPDGITLVPWAPENRADFFAAYSASFADRPGFPGWSAEQWFDWTVDEDFRPGCSLLARDADGTPVGFVTCADGFLIQAGTVPSWRRRGLGRALAVGALTRMAGEAPEGEVFLDVNVNNPASAALFRGLGFADLARRARFA